MTDKKTYRMDLDYESFLFDPSYLENNPSSLKMIREFEYVFFLINNEECILKNEKNYGKKYLHALKSLGFTLPQMDPHAAHPEKWWGHHHDFLLEQKLNSKLTSAELALKKGWGMFEGAIVHSLEQAESHVKKFPHRQKWIVKKPFGLSGIGHFIFLSDSYDQATLKKVINGPALLEPLFERVMDIGTTFVVEDGFIKRQFMVENFNSSKGSFRGGAGSSDLKKFKNYILNKYDYSLDELEKVTKLIADQYIEWGAKKNIQVDSFVYVDKGELKLYPLVEVNYRKTMGLVIQSLADKLAHEMWVEWRVVSSGDLLPDEEGFIKISPDDGHFKSFCKGF